MQLEELRMNKKMDEDDPALAQDIHQAQEHLVSKQNEMLTELRASWSQWDALVDRATVTETERATARDAMLNILNKRKYLANLLREIGEVLES